MHRFIDSHYLYNLLILTIYFSKKITLMPLLIMEHMSMFVVKSIHSHTNGQDVDIFIGAVV